MLYGDRSLYGVSVIVLNVTIANLIRRVNGGVASFGRGGGSYRRRCNERPCYTTPKPPVSFRNPL